MKTVYLDQNVLDSLVKKRGNEQLRRRLDSADTIVAYSDATLDELLTIGASAHRSEYLKCLENLRARYFVVDDGDRILFDDGSPRDHLARHAGAHESFGSLLALAHKLQGGKRGVGLEIVINELVREFRRQIAAVRTDASDAIKDSDVDALASQGERNILLLGKLAAESLSQQADDNPVDMFRKYCGVRAVELNNIRPPGVIGQILELVGRAASGSDSILRVLQMFEDAKSFTGSRVGAVAYLYNLLQSIGYHADRRFDLDRAYRSAMNDHFHVADASYTEVLLTRDRRMAHRAAAVYEYLNVTTRIELIS